MAKTESSKDVEKIKKELTGKIGAHIDAHIADQSGVPNRFRNPDTRSAANDLIAPLLKDGSTTDAFAALVTKDTATLTADVEKAKQTAVKNSTAVQKQLYAQAAQRLKDVNVIADPAAPVAQLELLNEPFLIWPSQGFRLEDSEIVPSNSWAKFRVGQTNQARQMGGSVNFYYLWENPKSTHALIDVHGYAIFNGHVYVGSGGGLFPGDRHAEARVRGHLLIWEWWNQPPTSPPWQGDSQMVTPAHLVVNTDGWSEVGAIDSRNVYRGYDLSHTQLIVPPRATYVFTVTPEIYISTGGDSSTADIDFASGDFQVGSPAVLVRVLS